MILSVWLACLACTPAPGADEAASPLPQLARSLAAFDQKSRSQIGVSAVRLADGQELLNHHAQQLFMPASNMKVLTSCFALARLGGDFKFETIVYTQGSDVLVSGNFDPILGDPVVAQSTGKTIYAELDLWARAVKERLAGQPAGNVIVIARGGDYRHSDWPADQANRWYCAPIAELNFNNNCLDVRFGLKDGQLYPELSPASRFIKLVSSVRAGKGQLWTLKASADCSQVTVGGTATVNGGTPVSVAIDNPPMLLGRTLADRLEQAGVKVQGQVLLGSPEALTKAKPLVKSCTPLSLVMSRADKRSVNMIAEGMFLRAGDGTFEGSARIETQTLQQAYGLDPKSFVISDGSGFSRENLVAPQAMVKLLAAVLKRHDANVLLESLPISGTDGTMSKRLTDEPYRGRVLAKTGYIAGVSCLSGYVLDKDGKPAAAFSVLVNKCADLTAARQMEERVCRSLVDLIDGRSPSTQSDTGPAGSPRLKRHGR